MHLFFVCLVLGLWFFPSHTSGILVISVMFLIAFMTASVSLGLTNGDSVWKNFQNLPKKLKIIVGIAFLGTIPLSLCIWVQSLIFPERKEVMKA